jgi:hypothetical protein
LRQIGERTGIDVGTSTRLRSPISLVAGGLAVGLVVMAAGLALMASPAVAGGTLHLKPHILKFAKATPGGACDPGSGCTYAELTIVNGTAAVETITSGNANDPFGVTWGGTCNNEYAYAIPADTSCTLQFGFEPSTPHVSFTGTGTVGFANGTELSVTLRGRST